MRSKRYVFLLEILIALTLMSMILSFLFSSMRRTAQFEIKNETGRKELLQQQHLQTRLQDLFRSIDPKSLYTKRFPKEKTFSLVAIFDNGIDINPKFSGSVQARIFLDEHHNLALALWPLEKENTSPLAWRKEILLPHIETFQFQFLGKNLIPGKEKFTWHEEWEKNQAQYPASIRLAVVQNGVPLSFAFFCTGDDSLITYLDGDFSS